MMKEVKAKGSRGGGGVTAGPADEEGERVNKNREKQDRVKKIWWEKVEGDG